MMDAIETMTSRLGPEAVTPHGEEIPVVDLSGLTGEAWMEAKEQGLKDHPEAVIFKLVHPEWVLVMSGEEYKRRQQRAG